MCSQGKIINISLKKEREREKEEERKRKDLWFKWLIRQEGANEDFSPFSSPGSQKSVCVTPDLRPYHISHHSKIPSP